MNNVTHIIVTKYHTGFEDDVTCFYSEQEFKEFLFEYPDIIQEANTTFYKVEEIDPNN
jgi:hypothetical protein